MAVSLRVNKSSPGTRKQGPWQWFAAVMLAALTGIGAGRGVIALSGSVSVVEGTSMSPTFQPGDYIRAFPITSALQRGDIVVLDDGTENYAIKRIVGLPGEAVQLWRGYVLVDRKVLREPYLPRLTYTLPAEDKPVSTFILGKEQYLVLGDNRSASCDGRNYGPVRRQSFKSRVVLPDNAPRPVFSSLRLSSETGLVIRAE